MLEVLLLGTALTGEVAIRTTVSGGINNPHLATHAWVVLILNLAAIGAACVRQFLRG